MIVPDASAWIENTANKVFGSGKVTWILDQFHALEHAHDAIQAIETDPVAEERLYERLKVPPKAVKVEPVIRELSPYAAVHDAVAKCAAISAITSTGCVTMNTVRRAFRWDRE